MKDVGVVWNPPRLQPPRHLQLQLQPLLQLQLPPLFQVRKIRRIVRSIFLFGEANSVVCDSFVIAAGKFGFDAKIEFTGVTASELTADTAQQNVLIVALAEFDSRVSASDIKITKIKSDVKEVHDKRRRLDEEETEVTFFIESSLSAMGYTDTSKKSYEAAYDILEDALEEFVEHDEYNPAIQAEATSQGVTVTAVADDSVDVGDLVIDGKKNDDDDDDDEKIAGMARGAFIGVMVGVGVAVVGGGYYIFRKRQEAPEATHQLMTD